MWSLLFVSWRRLPAGLVSWGSSCPRRVSGPSSVLTSSEVSGQQRMFMLFLLRFYFNRTARFAALVLRKLSYSMKVVSVKTWKFSFLVEFAIITILADNGRILIIMSAPSEQTYVVDFSMNKLPLIQHGAIKGIGSWGLQQAVTGRRRYYNVVSIMY